MCGKTLHGSGWQQKQQMRILIVEDDTKTAVAIATCLETEGHSVWMSTSAGDALQIIENGCPDFLILDLNLPDCSGFEVLQQMRNKALSTSVLILTGVDSTEDKVRGLDLGADDYLVKPFAMPELLARVRALNRRLAGAVSTKTTIGDLEIDFMRRTVRRGETSIDLTPKEFDLLGLFAQNAGHSVSREMLGSVIWKDSQPANQLQNVIDVHITRLRRKVDGPFDKKLLHTVRGIGFTLSDPIHDSKQ